MGRLLPQQTKFFTHGYKSYVIINTICKPIKISKDVKANYPTDVLPTGLK